MQVGEHPVAEKRAAEAHSSTRPQL
jgi:hypothetical protein